MTHVLARLFLLAMAVTLAACTVAAPPIIPVNEQTVQSGSSVTRGGTPLALLGEPIAVGEPLPAVALVDRHMSPVDLSRMKGEVLLLSIVPSLDTQVCERQTHLLGEAEKRLSPAIRRVTVSRDLPFAQQRFADETGFDDILYLSDYRQAAFGQATGLLVEELRLLARALVVVDRQGVVRYIQVVPELGNLPDMEAAFAVAEELAERD